jgi:Nif-specific regulatory protein
MSAAPPAAHAGNAVGSEVRPYARVQEEDTDRIIEALRLHQGNKTRAAISLGLTPRQLRYRLTKLKIDS